MIAIIQGIITKFLQLAERVFNYIFGDVQFEVLWNWLPQDIQIAAETLILVLFLFAIIDFIRKLVPFF